MTQVCPTYFGVCSNITALAEMCHSHGVPLMVDEAHGGHFAFHPSFPEAALALGADVSIQSTHKVWLCSAIALACVMPGLVQLLLFSSREERCLYDTVGIVVTTTKEDLPDDG